MIMKSKWPLTISAGIYVALAALILLILPWWEKLAGKPREVSVIVAAIFLATVCLLLSYFAFRVRAGSFAQRRNFGIAAGVFCGAITGIAGLSAGLIFGFPLLIALFGMPDLWISKKDSVT